jgi:C4-dicarboxylate transporter, DctM subunit
MSSAFIFGLLIALMLTGMPVSIALGLTVLTFMYTMTQVPIEAVALKLFSGIDSFEIMAIPFFILAGNFLTHGGVARRMIRFATSMIGHWYGGLGLAGVMACALFAAVSGSSPATVVAIGSIIMPAMVKQGFPKRFGAGVIATSGALGILIPPSIVMVIFAVATGGSVAFCPPRSASCSWPASSLGSCWPACWAPQRSIARGRTTIRACRRRPGPKACRRSAIRCGGWRSSSS